MDGNPNDALNFTLDWSALAKVLDEEGFLSAVVEALPPLQGNEDFWMSEKGQSFAGSLVEKQANSYSQGFQLGGSTGGDTFQIVQMDGRKPPSR